MLSTSKINNSTVKPVVLPKISSENIPGYELFSEPYPNVGIIAKKRSGKTSVLHHILRYCVKKKHKNLRVFIFCPTAHRDPTYLEIQKLLEKRGSSCFITDSLDVHGSTSIVDSILAEIRSTFISPVKGKEQQEQPKIDFGVPVRALGGTSTSAKKIKKIKPLEYIFIFDDLGSAMRHASIGNLLKTNRHYHAKVFISTQYITDLQPAALKQLDYFLCFRSFSEDKLEDIHRHLDLSIEFPEFLKIYRYATEKPYSFLYVDVRNDKFRKNFNEEIFF